MTALACRLLGWLVSGLLLSTSAVSAQPARGTVTVLAISDAFDPAVFDDFRKTTGLRVLVEAVPTSDAVVGRLRTAKAGSDLVLLSSEALAGAVKARLLAPIEMAGLPNAKNLDPILVSAVTAVDSGGSHAVPFDWFPIGLAIDAARLTGVGVELGPANGWDILTKPEVFRKAASCGFGVPDRPRVLYVIALAALAGDGHKINPLDRRRALSILTQLRLTAKKAPDAGLIDALARGTACAAILSAPDAALAADRAREAGNGTDVSFLLPSAGGPLSVETLVIPANAPNPKGAIALLDFLLRPDIAARAAFFGHVAAADINASPPAPAFDRSMFPKLFVPDDDATIDRAIEAEWRRGADH